MGRTSQICWADLARRAKAVDELDGTDDHAVALGQRHAQYRRRRELLDRGRRAWVREVDGGRR